MKNYYDIAIIGGGIGGLMAAYRITERDPSASVCIIEKGHTIEKRSCPIVTKKVDKCIKCPSCAIMEGLAGAGAFSDGKYVISTEYGGWLTDFMDPGTVMNLIEYVDSINVAHGATEEVYSTETAEAKALARRALGYDLHLLQARCKHLGTENNLKILANIYEYLREKIDYRFRTTLIPGVHDDAVREELSARFAGDPLVFQQFRHTSGILSDYPPER